jgi:hypothetical protein
MVRLDQQGCRAATGVRELKHLCGSWPAGVHASRRRSEGCDGLGGRLNHCVGHRVSAYPCQDLGRSSGCVRTLPRPCSVTRNSLQNDGELAVADQHAGQLEQAQMDVGAVFVSGS